MKSNYAVGELTLFLEGAINIYNSEKIKVDLIKIIERYAPQIVIIDFHNSNYMDSSGIVMLNQIQKLIIKSNGKLYLRNLDISLKDALNISGLNNLFSII